MKRSILLCSLLGSLTLAACDRPSEPPANVTVSQVPPAPQPTNTTQPVQSTTIVPVPVPGPPGPPGPQGDPGPQGKTGDNIVIVPPPSDNNK
jgi:hypothetical protein